MFIFIFIILGLVVYLSLSKASGFPVPGQKKDEAIDLLKRRYINGEIDEDTYEKVKRTISQ